MFKTIEWKNDTVIMIDQRLLPGRVVYRRYRDWRAVARAIKDMVVRGAPAIGVAAAMGVALGALKIKAREMKGFRRDFNRMARTIAAARPTAINLCWAVNRMKAVVDGAGDRAGVSTVKKRLVKEARTIAREDIEINREIGRRGGRLLKNNTTVLTHCNAGALATAGYGTALGVVRGAVEAGKKITVFADETRPFLQGARLTAWELKQDGIETILITDSMAGVMMKKGLVHAVVVGADRIAANGDVANKIGTYSVAVLARAHKIPFYVAAPTSTIDMEMKNGDLIPIEQRNVKEVTHIGGKRVAPNGIKVMNPAFDVTPARLVSAIITEKGVARAPYVKAIRRFFPGSGK